MFCTKIDKLHKIFAGYFFTVIIYDQFRKNVCIVWLCVLYVHTYLLSYFINIYAHLSIDSQVVMCCIRCVCRISVTLISPIWQCFQISFGSTRFVRYSRGIISSLIWLCLVIVFKHPDGSIFLKFSFNKATNSK